jgi:hypothetical protein
MTSLPLEPSRAAAAGGFPALTACHGSVLCWSNPLLNRRRTVQAPRLRLLAESALCAERTLSEGLTTATEALAADPAAKAERLSAELATELALLRLQALHGDLGELLDGDADLLRQRTLGKDVLHELSEYLDDLLGRMLCAAEAAEVRILRERTLSERALQEWIPLSRKGIRLSAGGISVSAVRAGLPKEARTHLRRPGLLSCKLGHQSLLGELRGV